MCLYDRVKRKLWSWLPLLIYSQTVWRELLWVEKVQNSGDKIRHTHTVICMFQCIFFFKIKRKAVFLWGHFCQWVGIVLHWMGTPFLGNILSYLYLVLRGEAKSLFHLCLASGDCPSLPLEQCHVHVCMAHVISFTGERPAGLHSVQCSHPC